LLIGRTNAERLLGETGMKWRAIVVEEISKKWALLTNIGPDMWARDKAS
jgi:hypothetical protein